MNDNKSTVYLCGGILGLNDDACKTWRNKATAELADRFHILDPMRRDYRGKEDDVAKEIVVLDKRDIDHCDVLLVNATKASWGTAMEIIYAYDRGKLIVSFTGDAPRSPWLTYHSTIVTRTLDESLARLTSIFDNLGLDYTGGAK